MPELGNCKFSNNIDTAPGAWNPLIPSCRLSVEILSLQNHKLKLVILLLCSPAPDTIVIYMCNCRFFTIVKKHSFIYSYSVVDILFDFPSCSTVFDLSDLKHM